MAPTTDAPRYSPDRSLNPAQHRILALLAEGQSIGQAAADVGIHRNTIRNWRRSVPAFAREMEFAMREQALAWHQQAVELAPRAAQVLSEILDSPDATPALRLRAALAILNIAASAPPSINALCTATAEMEAHYGQTLGWHLGVVHKTKSENHAQSCTTAPDAQARAA